MGMKEIWDGKDLPPVGCEVYAQLGSLTDRNNKGGWVRHKVTGYRIDPATDAVAEKARPHHFRISIQLAASDDRRSSKNERHLNDIRTLDWHED